jgi:hypothetical protein
MLNIQRMRDGMCRSHTARARTPNPKKRKWENYKTDRLVKNEGIIFKGRHRVPDHEQCGNQSIALARGFDKGSIRLPKRSFVL